ncbi:DUF4192 family protein [Phytomonospora sp. NPDC050363]|uniref:DUF4192 family protein n=1 Tax=Phytomonospora sp. NPDC050363 TaxID=3155642 RepID=UPI003410E660
MTDPFATPLRLATTSDFIAAVPYLLRFHPSEGDLAIIGLNDNRQVTVSARLPILDERAAAGAVSLPWAMTKRGCTALALVGYGPADKVTPILDAIETACQQQGMSVIRSARVTDGRYWDRGSDHVPPDGLPVPDAASPTAAALIAAGIAALPDRAAVTAQLTPAPPSELTPVTAALPQASNNPSRVKGERAVVAIHSHLEAGTFPDAAQVAQILTGLREPDINMHGLARTDTDPQGALPLWLYITRHAPDGHRADAALQAAYAAFRCGDSVLAGGAIAIARAAAPHSELISLIARVIALKRDPNELPLAEIPANHPLHPAALVARGRPDGPRLEPAEPASATSPPEPAPGPRHHRAH